MSSDRPGPLARLGRALASWRTASVVLLSFSSGLPLALVITAIPDWMRSIGVDIRVVGAITLAQAPWSFKMLWSPLMDRFIPPFLGRRRGWMLICQAALLVTTASLALCGAHPATVGAVGMLTFLVAFAAASQDIAIDAYAVEVLRPDEQGAAVGARIASYRAAMYVAGGTAITLAGVFGWPAVFVGLGLLYLPLMGVTLKAPEPEERAVAPRTLREAVWLPFLGFLSRHRALEMLAFVVFYKFSDQLAMALIRPFLHDMGYTEWDRGVALATVGLVATLLGSFVGGALTTTIGLGRALWIFGVLQTFANAGYALLADGGVNRPLMYAAIGFETLTSGMGTGAFAVLLLRMTQKRFSATQYALFSSLMGVPRVFAGPICGLLVDAVGWKSFFWLTVVAGIPGLILLSRFAPWGVRDPEFVVEDTRPRGAPLTTRGLAQRGIVAGVLTLAASSAIAALLAAVKAMRGATPKPFDFGGAFQMLLHPAGTGDWVRVATLIVLGVIGGMFAAAVAAARRRPL
ncbi:MAG TPA: MFS transporter [Candidatus Polarisedimenticolaceae bacterium]|nr:MFS transporter [Candidatus Polarisedimenticolaceae bacterium]